MAVFRVERTRDYTVMSNHHLKNKDLSLKAKGLLSQMLSLPENWDYTLAGLSAINRESKDAIRSAVNELEKAGYIRRRQTVDSRGKFSGNEYIIYEQPQPSSSSPSSGFPTTGNPSTEKTVVGKSNAIKDRSSKYPRRKNTQGSNTHSILSGAPDGKRSEMNRNEIEQYRVLIEENIDYDILLEEMPYEQERLEEIVGLMTDTVCSSRSHIRVAGSDFPAEVVKSRLLKLNAEHIRFIFDCLKKEHHRDPQYPAIPADRALQCAGQYQQPLCRTSKSRSVRISLQSSVSLQAFSIPQGRRTYDAALSSAPSGCSAVADAGPTKTTITPQTRQNGEFYEQSNQISEIRQQDCQSRGHPRPAGSRDPRHSAALRGCSSKDAELPVQPETGTGISTIPPPWSVAGMKADMDKIVEGSE